MTVDISSADLIEVVDQIFCSMAGMQLQPSAKLVPLHDPHEQVVSAVQIVGDWRGAVRLDIDLQLAKAVAANLTGVAEGELSRQDVSDAAGELANMVGGSVKAVCSHTSRLSLPSVAIGRNFEFTFCQGTVILALCFTHPQGTLTVSVIEAIAPGVGARAGATAQA